MGPADEILLGTPRCARRIAWAKPARLKLPCGTHAEPAQPEQVRAALALGVDLARGRSRSSAAQQQPRRACRASRTSPRRGRAPSIVCETPSISFSAMLPVKPSVTTTSATPSDHVAALDVADELEAAGAVGGARGELARAPRATSSLPAPGLLAVRQQPDARALDAEHGARERRAHEGELDEVLAPGLGVGADVEQRHRVRPGTGSGSASAGR